MRNPLQSILTVLLMAGVLLNTGTVEAAKKPKKDPDGSKAAVFAIPKEITLTDDQQTKLDEIKKEWGPKVVEANKKLNDILTDEQKTAKKEAIAKAKAADTKGKDRTSLINEALKLSDEQKAQTKEAEDEIARQRVSIKEQIYALLTDEQKPNYKLPKAKKAK